MKMLLISLTNLLYNIIVNLLRVCKKYTFESNTMSSQFLYGHNILPCWTLLNYFGSYLRNPAIKISQPRLLFYILGKEHSP